MVWEEAPDCTDCCRSTQHGDIITAAISRQGVSDYDLCSYLKHICNCCESVKDSTGRRALHVAASCGRVQLVKWLVQNRHADINARDDESGFTPLHRSILYGKIQVAVELMKLGALTTLLDLNRLTVFEHAMMDGFEPGDSIRGELYVWGSNSNNSLGPQKSRSTPELHDVFHKKCCEELVEKVVVEKFHIMILTSSGKVYSCGHGQGGRLGLGSQRTVIEPEIVTFPEHPEPITCIDVAISRDHSLFLCSDGNLYSCGLNTHHVLGLHSAPEEALVPTPLRRLAQEVSHVCTGRYHSVAWGPKCLYTWGLNAGQLGLRARSKDKYVTRPRVLNFDANEIVLVDSSDGAVCVYTKTGDIYVLHEYQCRKIASRQLNLARVSIFGGKLNTSLDKELSDEPNRELKIAALTNTGILFLWQESDQQLCRCFFPSVNRPIVIRQAYLNNLGVLFVTQTGEAFQGYFKPRRKRTTPGSNTKGALCRFLEREDCICVKLLKFPRIHRAIYITSDVKGSDYCVVQVPPYKMFEMPDFVESEMKRNLNTLLEACNENDDMHDVVFKLDGRCFPAHKYIVASRSTYFEKLLPDCDKVLTLNGYDPYIFEQFLAYAYTGECKFLESDKFKNLREECKDAASEEIDIDENISAFEVYTKMAKQKQEDKANELKNTVRMLREMAKKFGCADLYEILKNYELEKSVIRKNNKKKVIVKSIQFDQTSLPDFYDVTIMCTHGKEVKAHKCILASQSEYFNNLFSTRWHGNDTTTITLPYPKNTVDVLLDYLYTDILSCKNTDLLFQLITLADHLLINRLKEQCECNLFHRLTLKNAVQFLSFASTYNANKLKYCCMNFIASNIAPLLEVHAFDDMDEELLKELSNFYFVKNREVSYRVLTPYSTAPLEEEIISISSAYPVSLDAEVEKSVQKSGQKRRSRGHKSADSTQKSVKEEACEENFLQFPDSPPLHCNIESVALSRLRAIKLAEASLESQEYSPKMTKLVSKNSADSDVFDSSFEEFPLLSSPPSSSSLSKSHRFDSKHKIVKISQKLRKRLSSDSSEIPTPDSPKNPWKIVSDVESPPTPGTSMSAIISSEKKQKENLVKIQSKLLKYTQIEDKAIEDLRRFYNVENDPDELIRVERVNNIGAVATPIWVPGVKKLDSS